MVSGEDSGVSWGCAWNPNQSSTARSVARMARGTQMMCFPMLCSPPLEWFQGSRVRPLFFLRFAIETASFLGGDVIGRQVVEGEDKMVLGHVRVLMNVCAQGEGDPFPLGIDEGEQIPAGASARGSSKPPAPVP